MAAIFLPQVMAQVVICHDVPLLSHSGSGGYETVKSDFDSISFSNGILLAYKGGISSDFIRVTSIEMSATEENRRILNDIGTYNTNLLKKRCKNSAIGFFVAGTSMIFLGNIIADVYSDNQSDKLAERIANEKMKQDEIDKLTKTTKNNTKVIRYTTTGIGAVFQIVGVCQTVKLASGSSFSYGIKDNGVTLTYKFR